MKNNRLLVSESIRYLWIGLLTTGINILVYKLCLMMHLNYLIATSIAFVLSIIFAYFANKLYVFKAKGSASVFIEFIKFTGTRVSTFLLETVLLMGMIEGLIIDEMISKIVVNVVVIVLNYVLSKFWIFKTVKDSDVK